jgi:hypothetical protein
MKKFLSILAIVILALNPTSASAAAKSAGDPCKKSGYTVISQINTNKSVKLTCTKVGKKFVYKQTETIYKVKTLLTISQVWKGNKVELSLLDSAGENCGPKVWEVGHECQGFYIGWRSNFDDNNRVVDYSSDVVTIISGLQPGDAGAFQLMYQENIDATPLVVKEFIFSFDY